MQDEEDKMKIQEMSSDITYLECPDYKCEKWFDDTSCEIYCPYKNQLVKLVKCWRCEKIIELSLGHTTAQRLDHKCNDDSTPIILESGIIMTLREKIER